LIQYHAFMHNQIVGTDYDFFVEGDDMIIGYHDLEVWQQLKATYDSAGF
jgi:hypothetical protein